MELFGKMYETVCGRWIIRPRHHPRECFPKQHDDGGHACRPHPHPVACPPLVCHPINVWTCTQAMLNFHLESLPGCTAGGVHIETFCQVGAGETILAAATARSASFAFASAHG